MKTGYACFMCWPTSIDRIYELYLARSWNRNLSDRGQYTRNPQIRELKATGVSLSWKALFGHISKHEKRAENWARSGVFWQI